MVIHYHGTDTNAGEVVNEHYSGFVGDDHTPIHNAARQLIQVANARHHHLKGHTMTTVPAHLPQLANHPDGDTIENWKVYKDHAHAVESYARHYRTHKAMLPYIEECQRIAANYRPDNLDPSEIGYGRTILALAAAITNNLPRGPKWADTARQDLAHIL